MVKEARVFSVRMARNMFHFLRANFFGSDVSVTVIIISGVNFRFGN